MRRNELGRWGEDLVATALGFRRVKFSGSVWPWLEDLARTFRGRKELAQVKTTESEDWVSQWIALVQHAEAEDATARWFNVVKTHDAAYIFEVVLRKEITLGIGGGEQG